MKVGVSSWFGNLTEYEERHRSGAFAHAQPLADAAQFRRETASADEQVKREQANVARRPTTGNAR